MKQKGTSKPFVSIFTAVLLVGVLGGIFYFGYRNSDNTPPRLEIGSAAILGMLKEGKQGFLEFEKQDITAFESRKEDFDGEPVKLASGVNYVYAEKKLTVKDIVECVDPKVESFLFAHYDYNDKVFYTYPKGPFGEETKETDLDYEVMPGHGFVLIVKEDADAYCLKSAKERANYVVRELLPYDKKGWVLFAASNENLVEVLDPFAGRIKLVFKMTGAEKFERLEEEDADEELDDYYLLWMKLKEKEVKETEVEVEEEVAMNAEKTPTNLEVNKEDATHMLFTWDAPQNVTGLTNYSIHRSIVTEDGNEKWLDTITSAPGSIETSKTIFYDDLIRGSSYVFKVGAVYDNDKGNPFYSDKVELIYSN